MIPYGHQYIDKNDINEVVKVLCSDWLTQGPKVLEFEKKLARYCGSKYAVAVSNGTSALHLAYLVAGLSKGDEVITTPNTFVATTNMMLAVGAKPVFCDIRSDTYNIDESKIEKLITKKTKAIVPVHFAGHACEMFKIQTIAKRNKLIVIEDACHALGARYKTSKIGSCKYSDMAVFSFHPVKSITTAEGGAILTNNKKYYDGLISLRSHGIYKDEKGSNVMTELGYNYRMTDIQASLGISQLKKLNYFIRTRRKLAKEYKKQLSSVSEIILPNETIGSSSAWHLFIIRTRNKKERSALLQILRNHGIGTQIHYPTVYSHPYYKEHGYAKVRCKISEAYSDTCLILPLYPALINKEVKSICDKIKRFYVK